MCARNDKEIRVSEEWQRWMDGWMVNESGNRRRRTIRNANVKMEEKRPKYLLLRLLEKHGRRRRHKRPQITI